MLWLLGSGRKRSMKNKIRNFELVSPNPAASSKLNFIFLREFLTKFIYSTSLEHLGKMADELSDDDLQTVYCWVDSIQLSRPKRNISRDFADGGKIHFLDFFF